MKYIAENIKLNIDELITTNVREAVIKKLRLKEDCVKEFNIIRCSLDSRFHKTNGIFKIYTVTFCYTDKLHNRKDILPYKEPKYGDIKSTVIANNELRPVIIGSGPAGLFAAMKLVEAGSKPLILEIGQDIPHRISDIKELNENGVLNTRSNVQFGLGGAGTFSDGKLMSRIKDPLASYVLDTFIRFGAKKEIAYLAKPHVGTDKIREIIASMKDYLTEQGAEFRFGCEVTDITVKDSALYSVTVNESEIVRCDTAFLCIGNAARDTFKMLRERGVSLQAKAIAIGVRVEHEQRIFNEYIYGKYAEHSQLGAAEYKLTYNDEATGRSVYTFCNCPGGFVINSSTEEDGVCVNGMSYSRRSGKNANAAFVVNIKAEDYDNPDDPLSGIDFQRNIERRAYLLGGENHCLPVMNIDDFTGIKSEKHILPTVRPSYKYCDISECFPEFVSEALKNALSCFSQTIDGFSEGVITVCETRTSSPVRILRDTSTGESLSVKGLYPAGEGAGYAGGITSSAVDGLKAALKFIESH